MIYSIKIELSISRSRGKQTQKIFSDLWSFDIDEYNPYEIWIAWLSVTSHMHRITKAICSTLEKKG